MEIDTENIISIYYLPINKFEHNKKFQHITSVAFKILLTIWMLEHAIILMDRGYFDYDKYESEPSYFKLFL